MSASTLNSQPSTFIPILRGENRLEVVAAGDEHELLLIGAIGKSWFDDTGITEQEVRDALNSIPAGKRIRAKINSEGGSVQDGLGIYNAFKDRRADITAEITGYALSIASVFPLGAGRVVSPKSAIWMMHKAWGWTKGNADDMRRAAEMMDTHDETLVDIYAAETGKSKSEIKNAMQKETWIKGADAVEWGLADETDKEECDACETKSQGSYRRLSAEYLQRCHAPPEILNALTAHDVGGANQPTQPKENSMSNPATTAPQNTQGDRPPVPDIKPAAAAEDPVAKLMAQLQTERTARITAEVNRRAENRITNANLGWWIDRAMENEDLTYAQIDALPANKIGSDPLGPGRIEVSDGPSVPGFEGRKCLPEVVNMFKGLPPVEQSSRGHIISAQNRLDILKANWHELTAKARSQDKALMDRSGFMPVVANTYSATLVTNFLILGAITYLSPKFAPLLAFTRDTSVDPYKPLATGQMKLNTAAQDASDVQTNETNWETSGHSDSTVTNVQITVAQYSSILHVTQSELNSGLRMEDLTTAKLASLGAKITQVATAPITAANYSTLTGVVSAAAAFGFSDLQTLWGQLKKSSIKNVILNGEYLARIINQPTLFQATPVVPGAGWRNLAGWDFVGLNTDWSGAGANVQGFACNPQAIGCIQGLPLNPPEGIPGNTLMTSTITVPGVDVTVALYVWFSLAGRTLYSSYDIMFGAAKLDPTAGALITSA